VTCEIPPDTQSIYAITFRIYALRPKWNCNELLETTRGQQSGQVPDA